MCLFKTLISAAGFRTTHSMHTQGTTDSAAVMETAGPSDDAKTYKGPTKAEKEQKKLKEKEQRAQQVLAKAAALHGLALEGFGIKLKSGAEKVGSGEAMGGKETAVSVPWGFDCKNGKKVARPFSLGQRERERDTDGGGASLTTTFDFVKSEAEKWCVIEEVITNDTTDGSIYFKTRLRSGSVVVFSLRPPSPFADSKSGKPLDTNCMIYFNSWQARKAHGLSWEAEKEAYDAAKEARNAKEAKAQASDAAVVFDAMDTEETSV